MTRQRTKRDDQQAYEFVVETFGDIRSRLKAGGCALSEDEAALVLANLVTPAAPKSRPPHDINEQMKIFAALYCLRLENDGMSMKDAVATAAAKYGYSKWTMRTARREMLKK